MNFQPFDIFAQALWQFNETGKADLRTEREDGFKGREFVQNYFTTYADFPTIEKQALKFARGRVLDVGCGAGRHSLYFQRRGVHATAIDVSPPIVQLAQARGVRNVRVADISRKLPFAKQSFDTVLLFGNNLGIAGSLPHFRRMLRELDRVTSPRGRIIATTRQPSTTNPLHRSYLRKNLKRGRYCGQIRMRLRFGGKRGGWFDLLLLAPTDLMRMALEEGWELKQVFTEKNFELGYAVVMEKRQ